MKKVLIVATFIGAHQSLGYEHGKKYLLNLKTADGSNPEVKAGTVYISRTDKSGKCEYSNLQKFFDNWENASNGKGRTTWDGITETADKVIGMDKWKFLKNSDSIKVGKRTIVVGEII